MRAGSLRQRQRRVQRERQREQQRRDQQHHPGDRLSGAAQQNRGRRRQAQRSPRAPRRLAPPGADRTAWARSPRAGRARGCRAAGSALRRVRRASRRRRRSRRSASRRRAGCRRANAERRGSPGWSGTGGSRARRRARGRARTRPGRARAASSDQHRDHRRRRVAVAAQVGDQAPALGDGEQHRVEREQEPHERADHREKRRRLVARGRGLRKQPFVIADVLTFRRPAASARRPRARGPRAGRGAHEDAAKSAAQTRGFLRVEQRRERRSGS